MKKLLFNFTLVLTLSPSLLFCQTQNDAVLDIRKKFKIINGIKDYQIKILENEEFLDQMTDGGGELKGFLKNDTVFKIVEKVGLSFGVITLEYYYWNEQLIFVYEKEQTFKYDDSTGSFNYDILNTNFEGRYYFSNQKLFKTKIKGKKMFPDDISFDSQTKEGQLLDFAKEYILLIKM